MKIQAGYFTKYDLYRVEYILISQTILMFENLVLKQSSYFVNVLLGRINSGIRFRRDE